MPGARPVSNCMGACIRILSNPSLLSLLTDSLQPIEFIRMVRVLTGGVWAVTMTRAHQIWMLGIGSRLLAYCRETLRNFKAFQKVVNGKIKRSNGLNGF